MGLYMRFINTDDRGLDLDQIEQGLKNFDPRYSIVNRWTDRIIGDLMCGDELCAQIEINGPSETLFGEEVEELKEFAGEAGGRGLRKVLACLGGAEQIVAVQILYQDRNPDATWDMLAPLRGWLLMSREGLLQVDRLGYYDKRMKLILAVE